MAPGGEHKSNCETARVKCKCQLHAAGHIKGKIMQLVPLTPNTAPMLVPHSIPSKPAFAKAQLALAVFNLMMQRQARNGKCLLHPPIA